MKIAMPIAEGALCRHFGHCEQFGIVPVHGDGIGEIEMLQPPPHEPGVLPRWLHEQGVNVVLAGGMGMRAQELFRSYGIEVVVGVEPGPPAVVAKAFVDGNLVTGANACDH